MGKVNVFLSVKRPRVPHHFHGDSTPSIYSEHFSSSRDPGSFPHPSGEVAQYIQRAGHTKLLCLPLGGGQDSPASSQGLLRWGSSITFPHRDTFTMASPREMKPIFHVPKLDFPQYCSLEHVLWSPLRHTNSWQETLRRKGDPQVHRVTLANYFGISLKQWSNSFSMSTLWNHVSTLWSGLHTFLFKYHFKKKKKKEPKGFKSNLKFKLKLSSGS